MAATRERSIQGEGELSQYAGTASPRLLRRGSVTEPQSLSPSSYRIEMKERVLFPSPEQHEVEGRTCHSQGETGLLLRVLL